MDVRLDGKVALITGGSMGMGKAMAEKFAASGAEVAIVARRPEPLAEAAREIVAAGGHCRPYSGDVSKADEVNRLFSAITDDFGHVDILVNNAGVIKDDLFVRMEPEAWQTVLQTNLGGVFNFCKAVGYTMMKQRRGRIINISSVAVLVPKWMTGTPVCSTSRRMLRTCGRT